MSDGGDTPNSTPEPSRLAGMNSKPCNSKRFEFTQDMQSLQAIEIPRQQTARAKSIAANVGKSDKLSVTKDNMHHGSVTMSDEEFEDSSNLFQTTAWWDWKGLELSLPDDLVIALEYAKQGLDIIVTVLEAVSKLLEILRALLVGLSDLLMAIIDPIIEKLEEILDLFRGRTGIHLLMVPPVMKELSTADAAATLDFLQSVNENSSAYIMDRLEAGPGFKIEWSALNNPTTIAALTESSNTLLLNQEGSPSRRTRGGNMGFYDLIKETMDDTEDLARPRFGENAWVGGMVLMAGAPGYAQFMKLWADLKKLFSIQDDSTTLGAPPPVSGFTVSVDSEFLNASGQGWDTFMEVLNKPFDDDLTKGFTAPWYGPTSPIVGMSWDSVPKTEGYPHWEPFREVIIRVQDPSSLTLYPDGTTMDLTGFGSKEEYEEEMYPFNMGDIGEIDPYGHPHLKSSHEDSHEAIKKTLKSKGYSGEPGVLNKHVIALRNIDGLAGSDSVVGAGGFLGMPSISLVSLAQTLVNTFNDVPEDMKSGMLGRVWNFNLAGFDIYEPDEYQDDYRPAPDPKGNKAMVAGLDRASTDPVTYHYRLVRFYRRVLGVTPNKRTGLLGWIVRDAVYEKADWVPTDTSTSDSNKHKFNRLRTVAEIEDDGVKYQEPLIYPSRDNIVGTTLREEAAYAVSFSSIGTIIVPPINTPKSSGPEPNWMGLSFGSILPRAIGQILKWILDFIKQIRSILKGLLGWIISMIDALIKMVNKWKKFILKINSLISRLQKLLMIPVGGYVLTFFGKGGNEFFLKMLKETLELGIADRKAREAEKLKLIEEAVRSSMAEKFGDVTRKFRMGKEWHERIGGSLVGDAAIEAYNSAFGPVATMYDGMGTKDTDQFEALEALNKKSRGGDPLIDPDNDYVGDLAGIMEGDAIDAMVEAGSLRNGAIVPGYGDDDIAAGIVIMAGDSTAQVIMDLIAFLNLLFGGGGGGEDDSAVSSESGRSADTKAGAAAGPSPDAETDDPEFGAAMQPLSEDDDEDTSTIPGDYDSEPASGTKQKGFDFDMSNTDKASDGADNRCPKSDDRDY